MADLEQDVETGNDLEPGAGGVGEGSQVDETKYVPITRFNEVYRQAKEYERAMAAYKKYGAPEEIAARHEKLTQWEKAVEEAKKQASATPDEKQAAERAARVRKELLAIFPELGNLAKITDLESKYGELSAGEAEAAAKEVLAEHSVAFAPLVKEAGIDPKYQSEIEEFIAAKMSEDDKIAFLQGDFSVAKTIFEAAVKEGLLSGLVKKAPLITPALRNPAGGTVVKGAKPKPLSMKEAEEMGWARMQNE